MKFRYKVIIVNIFVLSLTLMIVGYILMQRTYDLTLDSAIKSAVTENNLVQSSIEYSLLDVINNNMKSSSIDSYVRYNLHEIGDEVFSGMISEEEALLIRYADMYFFVSDAAIDTKTPLLSEELFDFKEDNRKNYSISREQDHVYLYVTSLSVIGENNLNIVTRRDITDLQVLLDVSITDYRRITIIILSASSLLLYIISRLMTRPLEQLSIITDDFANGHYSARSKVKTSDEVGNLSERFNSMADSVESHVEELNDMIHRREQFVADFTHEIKTPMTSIIGYADTMRSLDLSKEEQQTALNYIFSEGKRLESMSMKLFDLLYLKDHPIDARDIPTVSLGESIVTSMTPMVENSGETLKSDIEPGIISGDPDLLKSVFINLIDNARKASKAGDIVEFTGRISGNDEYSFSVKDHGIGISEEDKKKIFDEFFMVDKSRTREAGGAGLGMSLVSVILERHNAVLDIESTLGEGTTMTVKFNLVKDDDKKN